MNIDINKDISFSLEYHNNTKHSQLSIMNSRYVLDWNNRPYPFKLYADLPSIPLPTDILKPELNTIDATNPAANRNELKLKNYNSHHKLNLKDVATILFFSYGINRIIRHGATKFYMRTASATGALYPIELYLIIGNGPDLQSGIYHFNPIEFSLTPIRLGNYIDYLSSLTANNKDISTSQVILVFTSIAWKNAWKYQTRSYRHWFWDSGVIAANLLAINTAMDFDTNLIMGFTDDQINHLLMLEHEKEGAILMATIGTSKQKNINPYEFHDKDNNFNYSYPSVLPLSRREQTYSEIWRAYNSSKLFDNSQVKQWISKNIINNSRSTQLKNPNGSYIEIKEYPLIKENNFNSIGIGDTILKRGSARRFFRSNISFNALSKILLHASGGVSMDYNPNKCREIDMYLVINAVDDLEKGGYYFDQDKGSLKLLKRINSRNESSHLCLDQALFGDASAVIFLMTDLKSILENLGNRGYRAVQMQGGIILGKVYLLSYSLGLGASGSTFYDEDVKDFFSPHSKLKETIVAVGIGNTAYKSKSGTILPVRLSKDQTIMDYHSTIER